MGAKGERCVQTKRRSRRVRLVAEPWSVVLPSSVPKPKQPTPPEAASSGQKRETRMKRRRRMPRWRFLAPRERRVNGWIGVDGMVEKGWMPLERSDLCPVRREHHANRSTSPCCQAVRRLPVGHFGTEMMGRNIGPCDLPSNRMAVAHLGWIALPVDHGDEDSGSEGESEWELCPLRI